MLGVQRRDRVATPARSWLRARRSPRPAGRARRARPAMRSRRSLISRLVSRMPRASSRLPPVTRCGPRNTSPSSVATGSAGTRLRRGARSYESAIQASPIARRIAPAYGPLTRTTDDSGDRGPPVRPHRPAAGVGRRSPASPTNQESAAAGALLAHQLEAGGRVLGPLDDDVLEQIAEAGFDRALVPGLDLEVIGDRALLADLAVGLREHGARARRRTRRGRLRAPRATSAAPRGRRARARARAPTARATRARCARWPARIRAPPARSRVASIASLRAAQRRRPRPRDRPPTRSDSMRTSSALDLELRRASRRPGRAPIAACSSAWRSAVAELIAENTSLRAASTSASSPSISRCADVVRLGLGGQRGRGAIALGVGARPRPRAAPSSAARAGSRRASSAASSARHRRAARPSSVSHLLAVERDLLLPAVDVQLARVRRLARGRGRAISASTSSMRTRPRSVSTSATRGRGRDFALARVGQPRRAPIRSSRPAGGTCARTAPSPSAAARRAASGSGAPCAAWRFSVPRCFSTSKTMSSMRVRFCCAASSFSSAARRRALYLVTPAASSISWRRSVGRELRISPILPCSMIA